MNGLGKEKSTNAKCLHKMCCGLERNKDVGMGKYECVSTGTGSILHRITLRLIITRGLAPDLMPGRLKEWWSA